MNIILKYLLRLLILISLFSCANKNGDEVEILSLIYNSQVGNHDHFGSAPPTPPLPPDFDNINKFGSKLEAKKKLNSREWKEFFLKDSTYEHHVQLWKERMKALDRKIFFNTKTEMSEAYIKLIKESVDNDNYNLNFLEQSGRWKLSDIKNNGKYEILDFAEFEDINLDTIHVGIIKFSEITFNKNRDAATLYYHWICGELCGGGYLIRLQKKGRKWKIIENKNLWIS